MLHIERAAFGVNIIGKKRDQTTKTGGIFDWAQRKLFKVFPLTKNGNYLFENKFISVKNYFPQISQIKVQINTQIF